MTDTTDRLADLSTAQHNEPFEKIVLGCMLISPIAISDVQDVDLAATHFYKPRHGALYAAILAARAAGIPTEPHAIAAWLADRGELAAVGGAPYLLELMEAAPVAAQAKHYAGQLLDLAHRREILVALAEVGRVTASGADADRIAGVAENVIRAATPRTGDLGLTFLSDFAEIGIRDIEMRKNGPRGLSTGFIDLDMLLGGGLRPQQVVVIAARPGMGKSTLALDIARHASIRDRYITAFISMEMSSQELYDRLLSAHGGISMMRVRLGELDDLDWHRASRALGPISEARLAFDDSTGQTVTKVANKMRKLKDRHGLDLLVLDHLGLMSDPSVQRQGRQQEVAKMIREIKELAKELDIPIIVVVQLNRESVTRTNKRPQLTDLRESGEIEQSADVVILIHRDDYYDPESPRSGEADLIVAKQRSGPTDTVTVAAQLHFARFVDMAVSQ